MVSRHQPKTNIWRHRQNREPQICGWPQNSWLWSHTNQIHLAVVTLRLLIHLVLPIRMSLGIILPNVGRKYWNIKNSYSLSYETTSHGMFHIKTHTPKQKAWPTLKNTTGPSDVIAATTKGVAVLYYAVHLATSTRHNWRMAVLRQLKLLGKSGEIETNGNHAVLPSSAILMSKHQ